MKSLKNVLEIIKSKENFNQIEKTDLIYNMILNNLIELKFESNTLIYKTKEQLTSDQTDVIEYLVKIVNDINGDDERICFVEKVILKNRILDTYLKYGFSNNKYYYSLRKAYVQVFDTLGI